MKKIIEIKKAMDDISPTFCAAKWVQTTLILQTGWNHSCHHPAPHKIPLDELAANYKALHNTKFKKQQMQTMLDGERPSECDYCWTVEDIGNVSDRTFKTGSSWAWNAIPEILAAKTDDITPTYLEISFSNVCNFKCAYCSPDISSKWLEEIEQFGPYPTSNKLGNLEWLKSSDRYPYANKDYNPYIEAFWKWWPELSKGLKTLRLTGGEPLLSKDVWALLEMLEADPDLDPELVLGINTNLNVPTALIEKLSATIKRLAPRIKAIQIFTSNEATGTQAEYIRYGLKYKEWHTNLEGLLATIPSNVTVSIMTTINILSLSTLDLLLADIIDFRKRHNQSYTNNKLVVSLNYLRWPPFLHPCLAYSELKQSTIKKLTAIRDKYADGVFHSEGHYGVFAGEEISAIDRICNLLEHGVVKDVELHRQDFAKFVTEYDRRKGTDFLATFPELTEFYKTYNV
jgi:organic radical activating enzyme